MDDYLNIVLKSLPEKVHDEGIEKAKAEAEDIINKARLNSLAKMECGR